MNSVKAGPLWSWRTSGTVLSVNRSKPFRCRAYCCMGPAVAVTGIQVIFIPKYFIKKLIALMCKLFFFRWTAILTVVSHALEVWPPWPCLSLILLTVLSLFLQPALGRASWSVWASRSGSAQPCSSLLPWSLSDFTRELSNHPCADVSQMHPSELLLPVETKILFGLTYG